MKPEKQKNELSEEQKFEQKLFYSLKRYGYLFPENVKDVDRFEEIYGDTEIDIPEHLQSIETLNTEMESSLDSEFTFKAAALTKVNDDFDDSEDPEDNKEDNSEEENSPKI